MTTQLRFCFSGAILATFIALFSSSPSGQSFGRVIHVSKTDATCKGQSPCYSTIQAAIDSSTSGDSIRIQSGTYSEQLNIQKNDFTSASETDRIVIEADPESAPGSVVLTGSAGPQCTDKFAIRIRRSKFVTIRGLTITRTGADAIFMMGGNNGSRGINIVENRIYGNGSSNCNGGIAIARGNPDTLIANNLIYSNGRNGLAFVDGEGGPHYVINNTIYSNQWNGIDLAHGREVFVVNNIINQNGAASGDSGGRFGVRIESSTKATPERVHLLNNLVCGNRQGEVTGPALDSTDSGNLSRRGTEGSGFGSSEGCEDADTVFANLKGLDGIANTNDDDFRLSGISPALDSGMDSRDLGLSPLFNPILEADYYIDVTRPRVGKRGNQAQFDIGAHEYIIANQSPVADAGQPMTMTSGTIASLNGTASFDPDGDPISYYWAQTAGPIVTLSDPTAVNPVFTAPLVQGLTILIFQLTVSDGLVDSSASVNITVTKPNQPPALSMIGDKTVTVGSTLSFTVNATDPDDDPLTYGVAPLPANATFVPSTGVFTITPIASQVGSLSLTFSVNDGRGGTALETISITVLDGLTVSIASPSNGATVSAGSLLVTGTIQVGNGNAGVSVNGFSAFVNGTQWGVIVPIIAGSNIVTATAVASDGGQATASIILNGTEVGSSVLTLVPVPSSGVAPLTVSWRMINQTGRNFVQFEFDERGTGTFSPPISNFSEVQSVYTTPGLTFPVLRARDDQGQIFSATAMIDVADPQVVANRFKMLWTSFKQRLENNDIQGALNHLAPVLRSRFQVIFQELSADLPAIAAGFGDVEVLEMMDDIAEAAILQHEGQSAKLYFIYFRKDTQGRWLIEEM